jgi:uncharacterized Zn finger protein/DNA-binding XRE family transcriptional regulator
VPSIQRSAGRIPDMLKAESSHALVAAKGRLGRRLMGYGWRPYVPVAARRARARKKMESLRKKGMDIQSVEIEGRKIARTFWGQAWCDHLESFSDYANRLPRGRRYVRNGSVCHLDVARGEISAMVSGSELYKVKIAIKTLPGKRWRDVKARCSGQVGSLLELLQGRLSKSVMAVVTDRGNGLFPLPREIGLNCNCPDWAVMCKHVAAVLYGVGARLDEKPELLFLLRGVDHGELISTEADAVAAATAGAKDGRRRLADDDLADVFGIEMSEDESPAADALASRRKKTTSPKRKTVRGGGRKTARAMHNGSAKPRATTKSRVTRRKSIAASKVAGAKKRSRSASSDRPVTGALVARLRAKFGMSRSQFARLLGVSAPSISNWEKDNGALRLQPRTRDALQGAMRLTKRQATQSLEDS